MSAQLPDVIDEQMLCCPLCSREAQHPKVLPCLHIFCQHCLHGYIQRFKQEVDNRNQQQCVDQQYLTFPDTPTTPKEGQHWWEIAGGNAIQDGCTFEDKRDSGYGENDMRKKPSRYRDRGVLLQQGEYYRTKFKQRKSEQLQAGGNQMNMNSSGKHRNEFESHRDENHHHSNHDISSQMNNSNQNGGSSLGSARSKAYHKSQGNMLHRERSLPEGRKKIINPMKLKKTVSTPMINLETKHHNESTGSKSGHVFTMVNMFETKSSVSEQVPPMAKFRTKSKSEAPPTNSFVPLHQRPPPVYSQYMTRSRSHDPSLMKRNMSIIPRSSSLSTQGSNDSAIGSADPIIFPVFDNAPKIQPSVQRISSLSEDFYEGYEIPENLLRPKSTKDDTMTRIFSRMAQSGTYELEEEPVEYDKMKMKNGVQMRAKPNTLSIHRTSSIKSSNLGSPADHIYDEIPVFRRTGINTLQSPTRSQFIRENNRKSKDDHDLPKFHNKVRRNSSILDSYVVAGGTDDHGLNTEIPLCTDDTNRLSELYLKMDGSPTERKSRFSERYISMDGLEKPNRENRHGKYQDDEASTEGFTEDSLGLVKIESVATLIRAISEDFGNTRKASEESEDFIEMAPVEEEEEEPQSPVIYVNTPPTVTPAKPTYINTDELELDMAIPIYDTPASPKKCTIDSETEEHIYDMPALLLPASKPSETIPHIPEIKAEKNTNVKIPCPKCTSEFSLPDGQVAALRDCNFASQLQEVVTSQKCERKTCTHCEVKKAAFRCIDCSDDLCPGCHDGHNWSKSNRGHKVVTLQELQSGKYQRDMKQVHKTLCQRDLTNEAKYICIQCEKLQCSDCTVRYCSNHRVLGIQGVADRETDFIQSKLQDLQNRQETFQGAAHQVQAYQQHCTTSKSLILDQISSQKDYIRLLLDQTFDLVRAKVTKTFDDEIERADQIRSGIQNSVDTVDHVATFVKQLLEHGNHGNMVAMAPLLKDEFTRLHDLDPPGLTSELDVRYTPQEVEFVDVQNLCGTVTPLYKTLTASKQMTRASQLMEHHTIKLKLCHQFNSKVKTDEKGCRPNGLVMLPSGHIVLVDNINMKLKIFSIRGELITEICPRGHHALVDPWDVTVLKDGTLAVTDKGTKDVKLFKQNGTFVTSFGGHLKQPWGICTNSRDEILVTDTVLGRVFIHDSSGKLLHTIPNAAIGKPWKLKCPEYINCNSFDDIIVSDFENHHLLVFDSLGRPLFKFGKKGTGRDEFYYPLGVTTDVNGNIYVANYKNQRITVAKRNGQFQCCLTTERGLHSLQAVAIDTEGHLVVIDGSIVKIFNLPQRFMGNVVNDNHENNRADVLILNMDQEQPTNPVGLETSV